MSIHIQTMQTREYKGKEDTTSVTTAFPEVLYTFDIPAPSHVSIMTLLMHKTHYLYRSWQCFESYKFSEPLSSDTGVIDFFGH